MNHDRRGMIFLNGICTTRQKYRLYFELSMQRKNNPKKFYEKSSERLLQFCITQLDFIFHSCKYLTCDGVATGLPLAPLLAKIFLK